MKKVNLLGFIQIPILIAITAGGVVLGGVYFWGKGEYKTYQAEKNQEENRVQLLADAQQKSLEEAKIEIEKLKLAGTEAQKKQTILEQAVKQGSKKIETPYIQASEIEPYLTGVVSIRCSVGRGTGTLWKLGDDYIVITNKHVLNISNRTNCRVSPINKEGTSDEGNYEVSPDGFLSGRNGMDITFAKFYDNSSKFSIISSLPISDLNYKISTLRKCPGVMAIGSPVAVIGFPATTEKQVELSGYSFSIVLRSTTEGIISAHDTTVSGGVFGNLPFANYFISAKLDSGNSGGIAFSKDTKGLCVLGVPTWISVGNYDTQGIIQNINNVLQ